VGGGGGEGESGVREEGHTRAKMCAHASTQVDMGNGG